MKNQKFSINLLMRVLIMAVSIMISSATFAQKSKSKVPAAPALTSAGVTAAEITAALDEAYNKFVDVKEGKNADYIKELANVDPKIFGIALVTTDGQVFTKGDITSARPTGPK